MTPTKPPITEKQLQSQIVEYAKLRGWMVMHIHDSRRSEAGWPDLAMCRAKGTQRGRLILAELKSASGVLRKDQKAWLSALATCGDSVEVYVWKADDWSRIMEILK